MWGKSELANSPRRWISVGRRRCKNCRFSSTRAVRLADSHEFRDRRKSTLLSFALALFLSVSPLSPVGGETPARSDARSLSSSPRCRVSCGRVVARRSRARYEREREEEEEEEAIGSCGSLQGTVTRAYVYTGSEALAAASDHCFGIHRDRVTAEPNPRFRIPSFFSLSLFVSRQNRLRSFLSSCLIGTGWIPDFYGLRVLSLGVCRI